MDKFDLAREISKVDGVTFSDMDSREIRFVLGGKLCWLDHQNPRILKFEISKLRSIDKLIEVKLIIENYISEKNKKEQLKND